jgi:AcrR family transcriptional regulator
MSDERLARVEQACIDLASAGEEITFDAVAARAGIGRATLYRRPELHAIIHEHREHGRDALTLTGLAVQLDQLRHALEAVAANVRRHEELLRKLSRSPTKRVR